MIPDVSIYMSMNIIHPKADILTSCEMRKCAIFLFWTSFNLLNQAIYRVFGIKKSSFGIQSLADFNKLVQSARFRILNQSQRSIASKQRATKQISLVKCSCRLYQITYANRHPVRSTSTARFLSDAVYTVVSSWQWWHWMLTLGSKRQLVYWDLHKENR